MSSKKKDIELEATVNLEMDSPINNGQITDYTVSRNKFVDVITTEKRIHQSVDNYGNVTEIQVEDISSNIETITSGNNDAGDAFFKSLTDFHNQNGRNGDATYNYLKENILANKDNPQKLQEIINGVLSKFGQAYDKSRNQASIADTQGEILNKLFTATKQGAELPNAICGTIHNFMRDTLEECGIPAVLVSGKQNSGVGHTTLLYQNSDGSYTFNNYGAESMSLNANNILDAAKEVYKRSGSLTPDGFLLIQGNNNEQYVTYSLERESAFGDETDKKNHILDNPFTKTMPDKDKIGADLSTSTSGNIKATLEGTHVYGNEDVKHGTSLSLQYKKSGETDVFVQSQSAGVKIEHTTQKGKFEVGGTGIVSYTTGETDINPINQANIKAQEEFLQKTEKISTENPNSEVRLLGNSQIEVPNNQQQIITASVEAHAKFTQPITDEITSASSISGRIGYGASLQGERSHSLDERITLESGIGAKKQLTPEISLDTSASAGVVLDGRRYCPEYNFTIQPGVKGNIGAEIQYQTENLNLSAQAQGAVFHNNVSTQYQVQGNLSAHYIPDVAKVSVFGNVSAGVQKENLKMSLFDQKIGDKTTFGAQVGVRYKQADIYAGYSMEKDALNKSRNVSSVNIGTRINF